MSRNWISIMRSLRFYPDLDCLFAFMNTATTSRIHRKQQWQGCMYVCKMIVAQILKMAFQLITAFVYEAKR